MNEQEHNELGALVKAQGTSIQPFQTGLVTRGLKDLAILTSNVAVRNLIDIIYNASDLKQVRKAWLALRKMGPSYSGWTETLQNVIRDEDEYSRNWLDVILSRGGLACFMAAESLANFSCLPNEVFPVCIIKRIETPFSYKSY